MEDLMKFTGYVMIAFGILQIILFFKVWIMTDDVKKLKNELIGGSDDWTFRKAVLKGDKTLISKMLFNEMFVEIKECYKDYTTDTVENKKQLFTDKFSKLKERYEKKYLKYGIEFPEAVSRIETPEDIENL